MATKKIHLGTASSPVRLSYVTLEAPKSFEEDQTKYYSVVALINKKDTVLLQLITKELKSLIDEAWGAKRPAKLWNPLIDGDVEKPEDDVYAGHYYIKCKSTKRPVCVDRKRQVIDSTEIDDVIYSGSYGIVVASLFTFDKAGNRGIAASLDGIQKVKDGERLAGSAVNIESEFDELDDEDYDVLG